MQTLPASERQRRILLATEPDLPSSVLYRLLDPAAGPALPWNHEGLMEAGMPSASRRRLLDAASSPESRVCGLEAKWKAAGVHFAVRGESNYPERLSRCADAPPVLFWRGQGPGTLDLEQKPHLGIVGTRRASAYGVQGTARLIRELRTLLPLVVSGGAYGIDACAHRAALEAGCRTWVVLAGGVDRPYPGGHRRLFDAVLEAKGCLLSECPPGTEPMKHRFPRRNRLIAGLCDALLVVESDLKGGSMITADQAFSYHREVLAFPGPVGTRQQAGPHALIRRELARLVASGKDICRVMHWPLPKGNEPAAVPERWRALKAHFDAASSLDAAALAQRMACDPSRANMALLEAELEGWVKPLSAGHYRWV